MQHPVFIISDRSGLTAGVGEEWLGPAGLMGGVGLDRREWWWGGSGPAGRDERNR